MTYITAAFPENVWKASNAFFSKLRKPKLCRFCTEPFNYWTSGRWWWV